MSCERGVGVMWLVVFVAFDFKAYFDIEFSAGKTVEAPFFIVCVCFLEPLGRILSQLIVPRDFGSLSLQNFSLMPISEETLASLSRASPRSANVAGRT